MSDFHAYADDTFVCVVDGTDTLVLCFESENPKGDALALGNIIEMSRRQGFRQAQEMLDKSVPA